MAKRKNQNPKHKAELKATGEVRQKEGADQWGESPIVFIFTSFDIDGPWGLGALQESSWHEFFSKVSSKINLNNY